jgi:two-component system, OmpR family, sensor kinase
MKVFNKAIKVFSDVNSNLENKAYRVATTVGIVVFALGVFSTYIYVGSLTSEKERDLESYQKEEADYIERYIQTRLSTYEELLIAGAAFHKMNGSVTRADWRNVYYNLRIPERASEILGYGYVEYVDDSEFQDYVEEAKNSVAYNYSINPEGIRPEYAPIKFIEPLNDMNSLAVGFDMYSEKTRNKAMNIAKDSGEPTLTGPVLAVQDQKRPEYTEAVSLLMYYPVYEEDRVDFNNSRTLAGYTYIIFRADDIMRRVSAEGNDALVSLSIRDIDDGDNKLVYTAGAEISDSNPQSSELYTRNTEVLSRNWEIRMAVKQPEVSSLLSPTRVFIRGVVFSLLLGSTLFLLLLKRASDTNKIHSMELQRSKDELLALASHQLRTPATGVRQYIGMLTQGYFGNLSADQLAIAKKAYETNDRQLETIDQLLYVAKADAGQLMISFSKVDIAKIVQDVIAEYGAIASSKKIDLQYKGRKKLFCSGDSKFIVMIVENLLSNAIKYSYPESEVCLELKKMDPNVVLKVKDQGIGIPDDQRSKLFQKFSRIDSSLSRSEGGSGLGLFLAQKLAQSHGGEIVAKSNRKGSTFILSLPLHHKIKKGVVHLTV